MVCCQKIKEEEEKEEEEEEYYLGRQVFPVPRDVTYGSRWLSQGMNGRPIPETLSMGYLNTASQYSGSPAQSRTSHSGDTDYQTPYMDPYGHSNLQQQPIIQTNQTQSENPNQIRGLNDVIGDYGRDYSSAHGLPNIYKATTIPGRIIWTLLFLTALGVCAWQFFFLIANFLSSNVSTEISIKSDPYLAFPAVTVCNANKVRRSAILSSKHREVLFIDDQQPLPYYAPCLTGDFACGNGELCIKPYLLCDGINHCRDGSDEYECVYGECGSEQFRCERGAPDGYCIDDSLVCDRHKDCYFGFDEFDCDCKSSEWKCLQQGGCIPRDYRCDGGEPHCWDKSDEDNCPQASDCSDGFLCSYSEECIQLALVCDMYEDCLDGSDESEDACKAAAEYEPAFSSGPTICSQGPDYFNCGNGTCYPVNHVCDGDPDCYNDADESTELCGETIARCIVGQFSCADGRQCVPEGAVCNIRPECIDGSDEMDPCQCVVTNSRTDTEAVLQEVTCPSGKQSITHTGGRPTVNHVHCTSGNGYKSIPAAVYQCDGGLYCSDPDTGIPETCRDVYSECYVREDGSDYKGRAYMTRDNTTCIMWTAGQFLQGLGLSIDDFPLLGQHAFCRNPDGLRDGPWCIKEGATSLDDWMYCDVPKRQDSCIHEEVEVMTLSDGTSSSEGRVEILVDGEYVSINDDEWTMNDGHAVCRTLGYGGAVAVYSDASQFGSGSGQVYALTTDCSGTESNLLDCIVAVVDDEEGDHSKDLGVSCANQGDGQEGGVGEGAEGREREGDGERAPRQGGMREPGSKKRRSVSKLDFETDVNTDVKRKNRETRNTETDGESRKRSLDRATNISPTIKHKIDNRVGHRRSRRQASVLDPSRPSKYDTMFTCIVSNQTIPWYQTCNNYPDCFDGSDEFLCGTGEKLCPIGTRPCRYETMCIESRYECDGRKDCRLGLDEMFCHDIECPSDYWKCTSSPLCIPRYAKCDTIEDCVGGEDELNCTNRASDPKNPFGSPNGEWITPHLSLIDSASRTQLMKEFMAYYQQRSFDRVKGETPPDWKRFFTFSSQADYSDLTDVLYLTANEIRLYGHQLEDLILECVFDEKECDPSDFKMFPTDEYGNCYTYNFRPSGTPQISNRSGPKHGLSLVLNLEQDEYISLFGQRAGARVSITRPDVKSLPAEEGFMIRPGVETNVGIRLQEIERVNQDDYYYGEFGTCMPNNVEQLIDDEGREVRYTSGGYDRRVCLQVCRDEEIRKHCECTSTIEVDGPKCKITNTVQDICAQFVTFLHQKDQLNCPCDYPCIDRFYSKTISQSGWPSEIYLKHLLRSIHSSSNNTKDINDLAAANKNLAKLNVYYEELNYEFTKESPAYEPESLFSDIGGTLGLYIGFSVITVFEFFVLIYEICIHCGKKPKRY